MPAGRFVIDRIKSMLLQHPDRAACAFEHEIVRAGAEPKQLQAFLQLRIVEHVPMPFFPRRTRWSGITLRAPSAKFGKQSGAENADVAEFLQMRKRNVQTLASAH